MVKNTEKTMEEKLYQMIIDLRGDISIVQNDVNWIKSSIEEINKRQSDCTACANSNYLTNQADTNRKNIDELYSLNTKINLKLSEIKSSAISAASVISIIIAILGVFWTK